MKSGTGDKEEGTGVQGGKSLNVGELHYHIYWGMLLGELISLLQKLPESSSLAALNRII